MHRMREDGEVSAPNVEQWRKDASARICAGSGVPVLKPGALFGTCSVCGMGPLLVHDGPPRFLAFRHEEETKPEPWVPLRGPMLVPDPRGGPGATFDM